MVLRFHYRKEGENALTPPPGPGKRRRAGGTLVEVMVAALILTLVLGGAFLAVGQGYSLISNSRGLTRASQILQSEIENLRVMNWSELTSLPASGNFFPQVEFENQGILDRYTCTRTIAPRKTDQKTITLKVEWTDTKGVSYQRSYTTFFSKEGLNDFYYRAF